MINTFALFNFLYIYIHVRHPIGGSVISIPFITMITANFGTIISCKYNALLQIDNFVAYISILPQ